MAVALEAGVVHHDEEFDTFDGHYRVPGSTRTIREARGAPTGWIPAWMGLSRSVNAVLVQIGMRVDDAEFLERLHALGYERKAGVTLGVESPGSLPDLPWKPAYSHASVSFGHEVMVNLWQHAAALATILRGGTYRPLRTLEAVEWKGSVYPAEPGGGEVVFSRATCDGVRRMMARGALDGTGRHLARAEAELGTPIALLSKTGTTEKEPLAPCLHLELERNAHNAALPLGRRDPGFVTFEAMKARPRPHRRSCYTSSICLVGSVPGEGREVMVLFVVDEPIGKAKFGSDVAGPSAMRVLKEALGLTEGGVPVWDRAAWAPDYGYEGAPEGDYQPWREQDRPDGAGEGSW
jgi:cell division protein FtsI/penicillin-binding protein 2